MDQEKIDQLKVDLDIWLADYMTTEGAGSVNEWYLQLKSVFDAAYGAGNW